MIKKKGVFIVCCVVLISFAFTLGVSQADSSWKFAFMGDNKDAKDPSGVNLTTVGRIAADMAAQKVSLVIAGGDLIDGRGCNSLNCGTDTVTMGLNDQYKAWMNAMAPVYNAGISVYAIPGNHEYWCDNNDSCVTSWIQTVVPNLPAGIIDNPSRPGREYSFIFNNVLFIGLDQNQFKQGGAPFYYLGNDVDWITNRLAARNAVTQPHVVAFGHMPQFMLQFGWSDTYKPNREAFWSALGSAGAKMYFTGHTHSYTRGLATTEDGRYAIHQILAGSAGAGKENWRGGSWNGVYYESSRVTPEAANDAYEGYSLVTVNGSTYTIEWRYYDPSANTFMVGDSSSYVYTPPTSITSSTPGVTITSYSTTNSATGGPSSYAVDTVVGFTAWR